MARHKACQLAKAHVASLTQDSVESTKARWLGTRGGDNLVLVEGEVWAVDLVLEKVT